MNRLIISFVSFCIFSSVAFADNLWVGAVQPNWLESWGVGKRVSPFYLPNLSVSHVAGQKFSYALEVAYPAGSWSPGPTRKAGLPLGGAEFRIPLRGGVDVAHLRYYVRFPIGFDFVRGGKLPGLYGGSGATGGHVPDGYTGFTTRYMWAPDGYGSVYAYLPSSIKWGTPLGARAWRFTPGKWHAIEQKILLNDPESENGEVSVWLDGKLVVHHSGLVFRKTSELKIDGVLFSTFFGGDDASWAPSKDQTLQFSDFVVATGYIGL
jgi:hypothetical protein